MSLSSVVPWGRSFDEYVKMFSLTQKDLNKSILGCGDGPSSFNSTLTKLGGKVISLDPIYEFNSNQLRSRIDETYQQVISQMRKNQNDYVWNNIKSVDELGTIRMKSMSDFLDDYEQGKIDGRYRTFSLPNEILYNDKFELSLISHFLFLYSEHLSIEFHISSIEQIMKVVEELRIFPLLKLDGKECSFVNKVVNHFNQIGMLVTLQNVDYEFQKGGNQMMVIKK